MEAEVWFRNPDNYIKELVEVGVGMVAWDRGFLEKRHVDPIKHAALYFGRAIPWRILLVGDQGTAEYGPDSADPVGVYPTWAYGEDSAVLEELLANPAGEDPVVCAMKGIPKDELPVLGQEHRVVITDLPPGNTGPGRRFLRYIKELQEDYPKAIIHVHGLYSWRLAFGQGYRAADVEPRTDAQKGKIILPSGKTIKYEQAGIYPQWIMSLGFKPKDLAIPRNRCMYNIKSAQWAGQHYDSLFNFKSQGEVHVDPNIPDAVYDPPQTRSPMSIGLKAGPGDKFVCDTCSLQKACKYFRVGSVCTLPGAESKELAAFFGTRDSGHIIDGLSAVLVRGARRLEKHADLEDAMGDYAPEVTAMSKQVFDQGVKLAQLIDPSLRGGAKVQVNVGGGSAVQINNAGGEREAVAAAVRQLELQGFRREQMTPELLQVTLEKMYQTAPQKTQEELTAAVVDKDGNVI